MTDINKYGLPRHIPAPVKREIRQRCGFGCVICGFGFYDYEHFDPDYVDAKSHNPAGMTLLCSQCNQKRARGRLSAATVAAANATPKCKQQGFSSEMFDFHPNPIAISIAGVTFYNCRHLIAVNGIPLLSVQPSFKEGLPVLLSGIFFDSVGRETFTIKDNAWSVDSEYWDVECEGPNITIRSAPGEIVLVIKMNPPSELSIERINMNYQGVHFRGGKGLLEISLDGKSWDRFRGVGMSNCKYGIFIENGPGAANDPIFIDEE